jgi:hypothetical protein
MLWSLMLKTWASLACIAHKFLDQPASLRRARNASRSDAGGRSVAGWSKNL